MSQPIIQVEHISKLYRLGSIGATTFRESIERWWYRMQGKESLLRTVGAKHSVIAPDDPQAGPESNTIWALKDVSFSVNQGEVIGIIGKNGAGKSTLLKILSRITEPTSGKAIIRGRVASLLEVGTGFHPELTGRENIYLNGAILGMRKAEITGKFDEIVAFAEIEKFIDTPVKRYSSGMYVRLAFAVAAHLEPEILLVDEVLAVGDAQFQKKCLGKMDEVAKEGRTVLFVSHNMGAINRLCDRVVWLDQGKIAAEGEAASVVLQYYSKNLNVHPQWERKLPSDREKSIIFTRVAVSDKENHLDGIFPGDAPIIVDIHYTVTRPMVSCQVCARLYSATGSVVFTTSDSDSVGSSTLPRTPGEYRTSFTIPGHFLIPGLYFVLVAAHLPHRTLYDQIEQTSVFEITTANSLIYMDGRFGVCAPLIPWHTTCDNP